MMTLSEPAIFSNNVVARWLAARATRMRDTADELLETVIAKLPADVPLDLATATMPELDVWRELQASAATLEDAANILTEDAC